jgi:hypothetical protein
LVLMVLPKLLFLIPFWRAGPALVLECYVVNIHINNQSTLYKVNGVLKE